MIALDKLIYDALELGSKHPVLRRKIAAGTAGAILEAVYVDSDLKKTKEVMDTLDLVSKARRPESVLAIGGLCYV